MEQLIEWFKELLKSQRVQLFIAGLIVTLGNRYFNINLDQTQVLSFVALVLGLIVADAQRKIGITHEEAAARVHLRKVRKQQAMRQRLVA